MNTTGFIFRLLTIIMYEPVYSIFHIQVEIRDGTVTTKHIFGQEHCDTVPANYHQNHWVSHWGSNGRKKWNQSIRHTKYILGSSISIQQHLMHVLSWLDWPDNCNNLSHFSFWWSLIQSWCEFWRTVVSPKLLLDQFAILVVILAFLGSSSFSELEMWTAIGQSKFGRTVMQMFSQQKKRRDAAEGSIMCVNSCPINAHIHLRKSVGRHFSCVFSCRFQHQCYYTKG